MRSDAVVPGTDTVFMVVNCIPLSGETVPREGREDVPDGSGVCGLFDVSVSVGAMSSQMFASSRTEEAFSE